jgi:hypothetical protein
MNGRTVRHPVLADVAGRERGVCSGRLAHSKSERASSSATGALHGGGVAGGDAGRQSRDPFCRVLTRQQVAEWLQVQPRQLDPGVRD